MDAGLVVLGLSPSPSTCLHPVHEGKGEGKAAAGVQGSCERGYQMNGPTKPGRVGAGKLGQGAPRLSQFATTAVI